MKKNWLHLSVTLLFTFISVIAAAQTPSSANYSFSTATNASLALDMNGNAIDMSTGISLLGTSQDDVASSVSNIGFDFWLMGVRFTQFSTNSNGVVQLGSIGVSGLVYTASGGTVTNPILSAFSADLSTGTSGSVKYKIVGSAPNRCLVIEHKNMTIYWSSAYTNDGTFQTRLYETTGIVEFVYGTMTVVDNVDGADLTAGIGFSTNTTNNTFVSVTSSSNSVNTTGSFTNNPTYGPGPIANLNSAADGSRRYYRFTPPQNPTAPTGLTFTAVNAGGMTLNWTDNANNEVGYVIYRSTDGINYSFVSQVGGVAGTGTTVSSVQSGLSS